MAYPFETVEKAYHFTAINSVDYTVQMANLRASPIEDGSLAELLHELVITPLVDDDGQPIKGAGNDPDFPETVIQAINHFFTQHPNAILIYLCDDTGGKQKARFRLFHTWFNQFNHDAACTMSDLIDEDRSYISILFQSTHLQLTKIESWINLLQTDQEALRAAIGKD